MTRCFFFSYSRFLMVMLVPSLLLFLSFFQTHQVEAHAIDLNVSPQKDTSQSNSTTEAEKAFSEGEQLRALGTTESLQKAVIKYEEALRLSKAANDSKTEANTLNRLGLSYLNLNNTEKSLFYLTQAFPILESLKDIQGQAENLTNTGGAYYLLGNKEKALDFFNKAYEIWRKVENKPAFAQISKNIGGVLDEMRNPQAFLFFAQAYSAYKSIGDIQNANQMLVLVKKGCIYYQQQVLLGQKRNNTKYTMWYLENLPFLFNRIGEYSNAIEAYNQLLKIQTDRIAKAKTLLSLARDYELNRQLQLALESLVKANELFPNQSNQELKISNLLRISHFYSVLGENQKAIETSQQAIIIARDIGDERKEGGILYSLGTKFMWEGEYQMSLDYLQQAETIYEKEGDKFGQNLVFSNLGYIYSLLGDPEKSLQFHDKALSINRTPLTLLATGYAYFLRNDYLKALAYFNEAMPLLSNIREKGICLGAVGMVYESLGDLQQALNYMNQSLVFLHDSGDQFLQSTALTKIGMTYKKLGDTQKALSFFLQALSLSQNIGDRRGEAEARLGIAAMKRMESNYSEARIQIESAIKNIELLRLKTSSKDLRSSFLSSVQQYYGFYIDLLMEMHKKRPEEGFDALAFQISERSRARSLLDILKESRDNIYQDIDPSLVAQERSLQQLLSSKVSYHLQTFTNNEVSDNDPDRLQKEIESLISDYQDVQAKIRSTSSKYTALTQPQPLNAKQIQKQVLDPDTLLLEYSLGEERSYLWMVSSNSIASYELPKGAEIEKAAKRYYDLLTAPLQLRRETNQARDIKIAKIKETGKETVEAGEILSKMLLEPISSQLGNKRLLIVPDGVLQYIPFAALPEPSLLKEGQAEKSPLVLIHEIIYQPSASTLAVLREELQGRKVAAKTLAIIADPVFDKNDERVSSQHSENRLSQQSGEERDLNVKVQKAANEAGIVNARVIIPRLPGTRREAEQILALIPVSERFAAFDFAANRSAATSQELSNYRYIHFATHGLLDSIHPELSGLIFSMVDQQGNPQNGYLQAHEIYNLKLPAEMITLSACETGLGKDIKGEGLIGLTRAFMYAGAARIMVSLWSVDDEVTADLMSLFYSGILKQGLRPTAALRNAQIEMLKQKQHQVPYYWAGFILQGEWK